MIDNNIYKLKYILKDCYFKFKNNQHIYILSSFSSVLNKGSTYSIKYLNRKENQNAILQLRRGSIRICLITRRGQHLKDYVSASLSWVSSDTKSSHEAKDTPGFRLNISLFASFIPLRNILSHANLQLKF